MHDVTVSLTAMFSQILKEQMEKRKPIPSCNKWLSFRRSAGIERRIVAFYSMWNHHFENLNPRNLSD